MFENLVKALHTRSFNFYFVLKYYFIAVFSFDGWLVEHDLAI